MTPGEIGILISAITTNVAIIFNLVLNAIRGDKIQNKLNNIHILVDGHLSSAIDGLNDARSEIAG